MSVRHAKWTLVGFALLSAGTIANVLTQHSIQRAGASRSATVATQSGLLQPAQNTADRLAAVQQMAAEPPRRQRSGASVSRTAATSELERAIARELKFKGYDTDGAGGEANRAEIFSAAIMAYEHDHGLPLTGEPTEGLFRTLVFGASEQRPASDGPRVRHTSAEKVVRRAQQLLARLGYYSGTVDGHVEKKMRRAIADFERDHGLTTTGRISGNLMGALAQQTKNR